jgi:YfiR/HmsC-like
MAMLMHRVGWTRFGIGRAWKGALALLFAWSGTPGSAGAQTQSLEFRVEAAFVYNFAKFVEWPQQVPGATPITFCVLGDESLYAALSESLVDKTINGRALVARQIGRPQEGLRCQIAFIGSAEKKQLGGVLEVLAGSPVLTVADFESFARRGGMIQLIKEGNKIRFAINVDAAKRHGFRISSKLLQLAEVIRDPDAPEGKP